MCLVDKSLYTGSFDGVVCAHQINNEISSVRLQGSDKKSICSSAHNGKVVGMYMRMLIMMRILINYNEGEIKNFTLCLYVFFTQTYTRKDRKRQIYTCKNLQLLMHNSSTNRPVC